MSSLRAWPFRRRGHEETAVLSRWKAMIQILRGQSAVAVDAPQSTLAPAVRQLPRPALRWVGPGARVALRAFDFAADSEAVCSFQRETYSRNFPDFRFTQDFADAFRHDLRRASLDPVHGVFVLDDGHICGFLWLVICENTWTRQRYGYVNNVYVSPQRRGQGLGEELMKQADVFFRERGIRRVRLTVTAANEAAVRLYRDCGYNVARWEMEKDI